MSSVEPTIIIFSFTMTMTMIMITVMMMMLMMMMMMVMAYRHIPTSHIPTWWEYVIMMKGTVIFPPCTDPSSINR